MRTKADPSLAIEKFFASISFPQSYYTVHGDWNYLKETIEGYQDRRSGASLDLNPDFQRGHVWSETQQIAYCEYILRGGTSGRDLFFNCVGWMDDFRGPFVIVDGKQRLQAATAFIDGAFKIFGKYTWDELPRSIKRSGFFKVNIANLKDRKQVLEWYLNLNSGGTPHSKEELDRVKGLLDAITE